MDASETSMTTASLDRYFVVASRWDVDQTNASVTQIVLAGEAGLDHDSGARDVAGVTPDVGLAVVVEPAATLATALVPVALFMDKERAALLGAQTLLEVVGLLQLCCLQPVILEAATVLQEHLVAPTCVLQRPMDTI